LETAIRKRVEVMSLFDKWCESDRKETKRKRLWKFTEKKNAREAIKTQLCTTVRSHYDTLDRIADDIERLGYRIAAQILRERLPKYQAAQASGTCAAAFPLR
jgi:hypothetical protein